MEYENCSDSKENTEIILTDVQNICRICLCKSDSMVSLLCTKGNASLLDMYSSVTSIKVHLTDGLPLHICELCASDVVQCYQFRVKCKNSQGILKSLIKTGSDNKHNAKEGLNESICAPDESNINSMGVIIDNGDNIGIKEYNEEGNDVKVEEVKIENGAAVEVEYVEDALLVPHNNKVLKQHVVRNFAKNKEENISLDNLIIGSKDSSNVEIMKESVNGKRKYYICSFCSKKFLKTKTLKVHMKQMHGKVRHPHSCGQCKESFISEQDLHIHSSIHTKGPAWICNQCHKEFQERGKLRRHVRRHMAGKRHACAACGKLFAERCALRRHARVHTGQAPEKKHACHICDKRYSESGALAAHVSRHAGLRPCACDTCGKAFPTPRLLASHRRVHSDRKPHACRYCDKRFRHESTRNTHHRTHTGEKPYVCSACGKSFIQNSNLTLHMRTHTGEKPYSCDICERKFSSGSALASHRRTHTGEKPYSCPVCGKRFARVQLSAHLRAHSGERPFACCACPKRFASAARLRQHRLIHTGEKPFECAICSEKFKTKGYLAKHLKNHEMIKNLEKRNVLILQEVDQYPPYLVTENGELFNMKADNLQPMTCQNESPKDDITVEVTEEVPLEVSEELVLPEGGDMKTELVVIDQGEGRGNICLRANAVNFPNNEMNYGNDLNLVTVNEGGLNISASSAVLEGTTVKLYQLDQSLVQIHTSGGQVTISKITSKMTANF
ncbi:uncharacterized protein [Epargyreus clarus]|uniref:uncharacterized protein n=1 Tax=Epargyreus clarus TaxID=520877 RepID=UPI003C3006F8